MADGFRTIQLRLDEAEVGDRRGFGHAVSLGDWNAGEGCEPARKFRREWRSARFHCADAMLLREKTLLGSVTKGIHRRRYKRQIGDVLARDDLADLLHVEAQHEDERAPYYKNGIVQNI